MFGLFKKKEKNPSKDDPVDFESMYIVVDRLGIRGYKPQHTEDLRVIWKTQVPSQGQADTLQGELLRQLEALRNEALGNGNVNWDDNFAWFCDFISGTLINANVYPQPRMNNVAEAIAYIRYCGEYARSYGNGEISDDDVNPMLFAYVDHDLYDYVADAIAEFSLQHPEPIPYEKKDFIYR